MSKLIFGCGYLGQRVALLWRDLGHEVHVVTRRAHRAAMLAEFGLNSHVADVTRPETLRGLPAVETVLYAVGFDRSAKPSIAEVYAGGLQHVLTALPTTVNSLIYVSTTGVYGHADGAWVDEHTPPNPQRAGGKASLAAERLLQPPQGGSHHSAICLRLAGIYGPDRIPYLAKLRAAEPLAVPQEGWLNLIHVEDAARIVVASETWRLDAQPTICCVSDGHPVRREAYYREVARLLGTPAPTYVAPTPDSPAALRASANKRVRNAKLLELLESPLTFPSYREGLATILADA